MSAVAAILSFDGTPLGVEEWTSAASELAGYGPDRQWHWTAPDGPVVLLRALTELTPSDGCAASPATVGDWVLVGDVRLDARDDLARSLGVDVGEAGRLPDEQLFARALEKWGVDAPERIHGGFGVIAWERARRRLHLWRDSNGERPLYFCRSGRRLFVASHAPVLLAMPDVPRKLDVTGLLSFMGGRRQPDRTSLEGITALRAAWHHRFTVGGDHESRAYWKPPGLREWTRTRIEQPVEGFCAVFRGAVADRLRLLGAKGGFCSGGLDSTAVTAVAAAHLADRGESFLSWTSVPHPDWKEAPRSARWEDDERPYVRALVRRHPNLQATFVAVDGSIFLDALPRIFRETASPAANPSNLLWGLAIRDLQREAGVRVPFVGGGGNGTISLDSEILWDCLREGRFDLLAGEWRASPREFLRSCRRLLRAFHSPASPKSPLFVNPSIAADFDPLPAAFPSLATTRTRFEEIAAGAIGAGYAGLSRLDPTRDRRVVDFCRRLTPPEFRHGRERRRLIRRAMTGLLPDEIRLRTTRGAQSPDIWLHWSRRLDDLRTAVEFVAGDALCRELLDIPALRKTLQDWPGRFTPDIYPTLIVFERTLATGLYVRWINDRLDDLPGSRSIRSLVVGDR